MSVVFYLTKRCNYSCSYCYAENVLDPKNKASDLTLDQLHKMMDSPYGQNALRIGLLGGEPFLNKDIFEILAEVKRRRKIVTIVSNASLIRENTIEQIIASDLDVLGLSLYPNNFDHVERVAKALNGKVKYWIQAVITADTLNEMEPIIRFCQRIGCKNLHFSNCVPVNKEDPSKPIYSDNADYLRLQNELQTKYGKQLSIDWVNTLARSERKRSCAMPFSYIHLDNNGNMGACCMRAPELERYGNIFDTGDAWNQPYYVQLRNTMLNPKLEPLDVCKNCDNLDQDLYGI